VLTSDLWNRLLDQFHKASNSLQHPQIGLSIYVKLHVSFYDFVKETRKSFDQTALKVT